MRRYGREGYVQGLRSTIPDFIMTVGLTLLAFSMMIFIAGGYDRIALAIFIMIGLVVTLVPALIHALGYRLIRSYHQ